MAAEPPQHLCWIAAVHLAPHENIRNSPSLFHTGSWSAATTCGACLAPPSETMQDQGNGRSYYRDDEIVVDRDGLPQYTGENPDLIKEY